MEILAHVHCSVCKRAVESREACLHCEICNRRMNNPADQCCRFIKPPWGPAIMLVLAIAVGAPIAALLWVSAQ